MKHETTIASTEQQAGQRLMVGFSGTNLDDELKYDIDTLKVGGLILFSRNIVSPAQIEALCTDAQAYAQQSGQPPLFIAIDQEGGKVARLKPPFTQFAGNPALQTTAQAVDFARITARELTQIGVNMNMAPVLDIAPAEIESVMRTRAFGHDPQWVASMGCTVVEHLQANGIVAVGKHFPGIGRTILDSHEDLPELDIDSTSPLGQRSAPLSGGDPGRRRRHHAVAHSISPNRSRLARQPVRPSSLTASCVQAWDLRGSC